MTQHTNLQPTAGWYFVVGLVAVAVLGKAAVVGRGRRHKFAQVGSFWALAAIHKRAPGPPFLHRTLTFSPLL